MRRVQLGELLRSEGILEEWQVMSALAHQRRFGGRFGRALIELQLASEPQVLSALGRQLGLPVVKLAGRHVAPDILARLPERIIRTRRVMPLEIVQRGSRGARLVVAFSCPEELSVVDEVAFAADMPIEPALASDRELQDAIIRHLDRPAYRSGTGEALDLPADEGIPMELTESWRTLH